HPQLGELRDRLPVTSEAGRERPDGDADDQVPDERRKPHPARDPSTQKRRRQRRDDVGDERQIVHASRRITARSSGDYPVDRPGRASYGYSIVWVGGLMRFRTGPAAAIAL